MRFFFFEKNGAVTKGLRACLGLGAKMNLMEVANRVPHDFFFVIGIRCDRGPKGGNG